MSEDIEEQLLARIKCSPKFAFQMDESTDVGLAQLLVFVRFCIERNIQELFMFCLPFSERCTGSDIFKAMNDYFTAEDISWANCVGTCTDQTGLKKGFQAEVQQIGPHVNFIQCIIHRQALASRDLEPKLHSVLQEAMKVVKFVKARPLNSRLFAVLCEEMQADHKPLLLHSKVRRLSRGKVLKTIRKAEKSTYIFTGLWFSTISTLFRQEVACSSVISVRYI
jgi:hypothetical protein